MAVAETDASFDFVDLSRRADRRRDFTGKLGYVKPQFVRGIDFALYVPKVGDRVVSCIRLK